MNLREALRWATETLQKANRQTAGLDARVLLKHVLGREDTFWMAHPEYRLTRQEEEEYTDVVIQRASGKPVSYIVEQKEFMGWEFHVGEGVLIPRPETELLTEESLQFLQNRYEEKTKYDERAGHYRTEASRVRALDMCTGSGVIAISLAKAAPWLWVDACDISDEALGIAHQNAVRHQVADRVRFFQGDLFEALSARAEAGESRERKPYDLIVANPPYIPSSEVEKLMVEVREYEPRLALDGGADGLDFYRRIIAEAERWLKPGGGLWMEIGHDQGKAMEALFAENPGWSSVAILQDLAGHDRVVKGKLS